VSKNFDSGGDGELSLAIAVEESGCYTVKVYYARAPEFGIVRLDINNKSVGAPNDTYLEKNDLTRPLWPPKEISFPNVILKKGENKFTFLVNSKNPQAKGYQLGLDCLVLERDDL